MAIDKVLEFFDSLGMRDRVLRFDTSSATVTLAAEAIGCEEAQIAKTLSFLRGGERALLVVAAGDKRIDNPKFKARFGEKAKMLTPEQVEELVGHAVGGVCPFAVNGGCEIYVDESLKRFETVYPAAGDAASAVRMTPDEVFELSGASGWVDVTK